MLNLVIFASYKRTHTHTPTNKPIADKIGPCLNGGMGKQEDGKWWTTKICVKLNENETSQKLSWGNGAFIGFSVHPHQFLDFLFLFTSNFWLEATFVGFMFSSSIFDPSLPPFFYYLSDALRSVSIFFSICLFAVLVLNWPSKLCYTVLSLCDVSWFMWLAWCLTPSLCLLYLFFRLIIFAASVLWLC